jgi:hypothetical protein
LYHLDPHWGQASRGTIILSSASYLLDFCSNREYHESSKSITRIALPELAPLAAAHARFAYTIKQVTQTGDIALMHTQWAVSSPQPMSVYAIEVARRQPDGMWCWLIGDPFTTGRQITGAAAEPK